MEPGTPSHSPILILRGEGGGAGGEGVEGVEGVEGEVQV